MKTLISPKTVVAADGKSVTITLRIEDVEFNPFFVQRQTVGHLSPNNMAHPRHIQVSHEAVFIKSYGYAMAITNDTLVEIAAIIEPKTTFKPVFKKSNEPLTVEIASELNPDFQWQESDRIKPIPVEGGKGLKPIEPVWKNIEGQTTKTLDPTKVNKGQYVRCIASSQAGSMASNPVQIK